MAVAAAETVTCVCREADSATAAAMPFMTGIKAMALAAMRTAARAAAAVASAEAAAVAVVVGAVATIPPV